MRVLQPTAVFLAIAALATAQKPVDDSILRAMHDELDRSRSLRVVGLDEKPYFIEYSIEDVESFSVSATLGALVGASHNRMRVPQVAVRAGSYEFDNTNHVQSTVFSGARYDSDQWPIDDDYNAFRHNLWLATDRAYKTALEAIARKRSSLRSAASPDKAPDFAKTEPAVSIQPLNRAAIDEPLWKKRTLEISGEFAAYPEIFLSSVDANVYSANSYYANSEGSTQRVPETLIQFRAQAQAQAPDGMVIHDAATFQALTMEAMPSELDLRRGVVQAADNIRALLRAPIGEAYSGPVLFEGNAAAQLMAQILGDNLRLARRPVSDPGRPSNILSSELESKVGSRILPDWISVVDDPTQKEWRGRPLLGFYQFDMEGVPPVPVQVVEKGVFKDFLHTRQPVNGFDKSNGRARLSGQFGARNAAESNLFISASETKPLAELKKQLMDLCKQRNKPYGMLVRKLDYPSSASIAELQSIAAGMTRGGTARVVSPPILVYRVYADGREELVRGLRFRGLTARSMRDILAASDDTTVFHFLNNGAPFALIGLGGFIAPTTIVSPSLLFDEVEFERPQDELSKPPLVPPPPIETSAALRSRQP
jgi:TldD protein